MAGNCLAAKDFFCHRAVDKSVDQIPAVVTDTVLPGDRLWGCISALSKNIIKTNTCKCLAILAALVLLDTRR
jgi:hypothetical protein